MNSSISSSPDPISPYDLLFRSLLLIPIAHYLTALVAFFAMLLYNFLEYHFIQDVFSLFRGQPVTLTFNPDSEFYDAVVSKCKILHGRYLSTPWLASPHLQTTFLNFFGRPPVFSYRRKIFQTADGGTIALDWLLNSDVVKGDVSMTDDIRKDDQPPIIIVVPGLSSDSNSSYLKHLAHNTAKSGWNVVITNHRGLGGVSVTSDCFYNAGWTQDIRAVVRYLHSEYPATPLYVIGTSVGANVLVKYLGEDGDDIPIAGAVAICSPWDLLIGDRFIGRRRVQKFYDRALAIGLQGYAKLHRTQISRLANWEGITKSFRIRDFDHHATIIVGKYETVDTFYRRCSSADFVSNVSIPLLCISSLDDPLCTREAIPWDECKLNKNIVLATTQHGGHLAFFEGMTASSLWWVRAVNEFLSILSSSPCIRTRMITAPSEHSLDHGPFVNVTQDGRVAAVVSEQTTNTDENSSESKELDEHMTEARSSDAIPQITEPELTGSESNFLRRRVDQLSRLSRRPLWLLIYISIASSWPVLGSALYFFYKRKTRGVAPSTIQRRR